MIGGLDTRVGGYLSRVWNDSFRGVGAHGSVHRGMCVHWGVHDDENR